MSVLYKNLRYKGVFKMTITKEQVEQLTRIYNTMLEIRTKGEDTLVMADCLRALEQVVTQVIKSNDSQNSGIPTISDNSTEG